MVLKNVQQSIGYDKSRPITIDESVDNLNFPASAGFPKYMKKGKVLDYLRSEAKSTPFREWCVFPTSRGFRMQVQAKND